MTQNLYIKKDPIEIKGDINEDLIALRECELYSISIRKYHWAVNEKDVIKVMQFTLYTGNFQPNGSTTGIMYAEEVPAYMDYW